MGRHRQFDVDQALGRALEVFWARGYEGASIAALTSAMGIAAPSLYAAFGDKAGLFARVIERYGDEPGVAVDEALDAPTALAGIERLLRLAVRRATDPATPPGCLIVHGALVTGTGGEAAHDLLATLRAQSRDAVERRLRRGVEDGDLPAGTDASALARLVMVTHDGLAVAATDGASAAELDAAVDLALRALPVTTSA